jgi:hypothetical protein
VQCNHESIVLKWDFDLNLPCEQLAFFFGDQQLFVQHGGERVTREHFASLLSNVKQDCTGQWLYCSFFFSIFFQFFFNFFFFFSNLHILHCSYSLVLFFCNYSLLLSILFFFVGSDFGFKLCFTCFVGAAILFYSFSLFCSLLLDQSLVLNFAPLAS